MNNPLTIEDIYHARLELAKARPYLAAALWALRPRPMEGFGTLGVTKDLQLFYDPQVPWRGKLLQAVLFHEAMHIISEHDERSYKLGFKSNNKRKAQGFNKDLWNQATDCEINDDLITDGWVLPGKPCLPSEYNMPDGKIAEEYYAFFKKNEKKLDFSLTTMCGTCQIKDHQDKDGNNPDGSKAQPADRGLMKQILQETSEAIEQHKLDKLQSQKNLNQLVAQRSHGSGAGTMEETLDKISTAIQKRFGNNWHKLLGQIIRGTAGRSQGLVDYTYAKPNRRSPINIILPSFNKPLPKVIVVLDISSSMEGARSQFSISVLREIIHACGVEWITIIPTNHEAHPPVRIRRQAIERELDFGGGTSMPNGLKAAYAHNPDLIIIVTDGETPWHTATKKDVPVAVAIIDGQDYHINAVPKWMKTLSILIPEEFQVA